MYDAKNHHQDSDVLVYTAACQKSIPIIYKLSRDDGSCDVLSMDWLFSCHETNKSSISRNIKPHDDQHQLYPSIKRYLPTAAITNNELSSSFSSKTNRSKKKTTTTTTTQPKLLFHLQAMVTRESRQKGSGARMFIQACILSGCDYCPNKLSGVGFVTACKLVKENAHRDVGGRLGHILKTFPKEKIVFSEEDQGNTASDNDQESVVKKTKMEYISQFVQAYEILLSKSEATFYYHKVQNLATGNVVSLIQPPQILDSQTTSTNNTTASENREDGRSDRFLPCISRFNGDISFTGDSTTTSTTSPIQHYDNSSSTSKSIYQSLTSSSTTSSKKRKITPPANPYGSNKKKFFFSAHVNGKSKLSEKNNESNSTNTFSPNNSVTCSKKKDHDIGVPKKVNISSKTASVFSQFAFDSSVKSPTLVKKEPQNLVHRVVEHQQNAYTHNDMNIHSKSNTLSSGMKLTEPISVDSDSDDDDILDEKHVFFNSTTCNTAKFIEQSRIITPPKENERQTTPSNLSESDSSSCCTTTGTSIDITKSKYFTFDKAITQKREMMKQDVTVAKMTSDNEASVTPRITGKNETYLPLKKCGEQQNSIGDYDESCSSNDCFIIDDNDSLNRQPYHHQQASQRPSSYLQNSSNLKSTSLFKKFQSQATPKKKKSFTPFTKAQYQGARAKINNPQKEAISKTKKNAKSQRSNSSIKSFFISLKTKSPSV